jgi:hypothetical protein
VSLYAEERRGRNLIGTEGVILMNTERKRNADSFKAERKRERDDKGERSTNKFV